MKAAGALSVAVLVLAALAAWASTAQSLRGATASSPESAAAAPPPPPSPTELEFGDARLARVEAMLAGKTSHEYSFDARKGQQIELTLSSDHASWIGLDLQAAPLVFASSAHDRASVYTNFIDGSTHWVGRVPANGTYTVRVGLLNAQARELDGVDYQLDVNLK